MSLGMRHFRLFLSGSALALHRSARNIARDYLYYVILLIFLFARRCGLIVIIIEGVNGAFANTPVSYFCFYIYLSMLRRFIQN